MFSIKNKKKLIALCSINILISLNLIIIALLTKHIVDIALKQSNIFLPAVFIVSAILMQVLLKAISALIKNRLSLEIEVSLKQTIYKHLLNKEMNELSKIHSGELSNIYLNDVRNINEGYTSVIPNFFLQFSKLIFAFLALLYFSPMIIIFLIVVGLAAIIFGRYYFSKMKTLHKKALESDGKVSSFMQESIENIKVVKAFHIQENLNDKLADLSLNNYNIKYKRNLLSIIGGTGIYSIMNITYVLTIVFGCFLISKDEISYGTFMAIIQLVSYFEAPFSSLSSIMSSYSSFKASKERINYLINMKEEDNTKIISNMNKIILENVTFSYDKAIYTNFNLEINKGDIVVLSGPSGSGKTTLLYLLLGFIKPSAGTISISTNEGLHLASGNTRNMFSYVPQENILFSGTIKENIQLFHKNVSDEKIYEALKLADIYDEVISMPSKLDTILNERGQGISIGQIQRILIAISLLSDKEIMLLDEFTSALDFEHEKVIIENIKRLNKTVIIISHRNIDIDGIKIVHIEG